MHPGFFPLAPGCRGQRCGDIRPEQGHLQVGLDCGAGLGGHNAHEQEDGLADPGLAQP